MLAADPEAMARQPRLDRPGIPQHIGQRGNNRLPCFLDDNDQPRYLALLREALLDTGCKLHASVGMGNHVHPPVTPPGVGAIARNVSCRNLDAAMLGNSTHATDLAEHGGKAATMT